MTQLFRHQAVQTALAIFVAGVTIMCVFTPDIFFFKQGAAFAIQIMFGILMLGLIALFFTAKRLMFVCLAATGILALYLKSNSDQALRFPDLNENPRISVAHIDLSLSEDAESTLSSLRLADVDVISVQEYTPYWDRFLPMEMEGRYPHQLTVTRIDPYGMAIFSKFPICAVDTIVFAGAGDLPSLRVTVNLGDSTEVHLVSSHTLPPVNDKAYATIRSHFYTLGAYISKLEGPVITLGDLSLPSWSEEVKLFKRSAQLSDSRRDIVQPAPGKQLFLFSIPTDHIFYSRDIECTAFGVISDSSSTHVGLTGNYQLRTTARLAVEPSSGD